MPKMPLVSIVITSYTMDRLGDILALLDSIKAQTYSKIETILVAERSLELYERIKSYVCENNIPGLKVIRNDGEPGLSAGRNLGIKEAKGDVIAFVDDDAVLFADWAEEMVKVYEDDSIIGVTGPAFPLWEEEAMSWFPEELYWIVSCTSWSSWNEVREVRNAWGHGMSFRRETFETCGLFSNDFGFHKGPMAEDNEFSMRVRAQTRKRIIYCPTARLWHRVYKYRLSWGFIKERAYWIGHSRYMLKKSYPQVEAKKTDLLDQEHKLLKRIFFKLLPGIAGGFFTSPINAWRKFSVTVIALFFVTLGYYSHLLSAGQSQFSGQT